MNHRILQVVIAVSCGLVFTLALVLLAGQATSIKANPGLHYVAPGGNCGSASPCYGNIQEAVDAASSGDEIRVAAGTYTGMQGRPAPGGYKGPATVSQTLYITKTVTVRGGYDAAFTNPPDPESNVTTLNAQNNGRVLFIAGNITPVIEGFHIMGGNAGGLGGSDWTPQGAWDIRDAGGGMYVMTTTVTVRNSEIYNNLVAPSGFGGGVYLNKANATLKENVLRNNSAGTGGGVAVWFSNATVDSNTVKQNSNSGIWIYGYGSMLSDNLVTDNHSNWDGGGVSLYYGGALFNGNIITGNSAGQNGGGVSLRTYSNASFRGDFIANNESLQGSGLFVEWYSSVHATNTAIVDNQATGASGGGLYLASWSLLELVHNTIARNVGDNGIRVAGVSADDVSHVNITNTILANHNVGIRATEGNTVTVNGILWHNTPITVSAATTETLSVQNQYVGDPAFAADGYHITPASAAINKGVDASVYDDIDSHARPFSAAPDLGADEWATVEVTVEPSSPSIITAIVGGITTTVEIPVGAVTATTTIRFTALATTTLRNPAGLTFAHRAFDLDAYDNGTLLPNFTFNRPISVALYYADADVMGLHENTLTLQYWYQGEGAWQEAGCNPYVRFPAENRLIVPVCHLSRFALFGNEASTVYLPLVVRN